MASFLGDVLVRQDFWPALATHFVERHRLEPYTMDQLIGGAWQFADHAFAHGQEHRTAGS